MGKLTFKQKLALLTEEQLLLVEAYIDKLLQELKMANDNDSGESNRGANKFTSDQSQSSL